MVEVGGRAGGAPPSAAGLRVNRGADTTTAQAWPSTSTYRVGDQLISAPERFLGSVTEGQIDTLPEFGCCEPNPCRYGDGSMPVPTNCGSSRVG